MTVVYIDSVFLCNALPDYLLALLTARLAGIPLRRGRYVLCGILGGLYAVAVFLPGGGFLAKWPVKAAVGVLLALIAFGGEKRFFRLTLLAFGIACTLAGSVLALGLLADEHIPYANGIFYTNISAKTLILSATGGYIVFTVLFRAAAAHGLRGELLPVTLCLLGKTIHLTALRDTGNSLRDADGEPVLTVEAACLSVLPQEVCSLSPAEALPCLRQRFPELRPVLLPIRTAAGGGLLLGVRCDWAEIGGTRHDRLRLALVREPLGSGYAALWGGEGRNGHERKTMAHEAAVPFGPVQRTGDPLHRRQRHTAATPEPGAGGGATGVSRR